MNRRAFSLLELMLALSLLGALMLVAWSLMGTFRNAEERGWKLAHRTQTIRAARQWLATDIEHLLLPEPNPTQPIDPVQGRSNAPNKREKKASFSGDSFGFQATIAPSLDPIPFYEQLMSSSIASGAPTSASASLARDPEPFSGSGNRIGDALPMELSASLWPEEQIVVEYRLKPTGVGMSTSIDFATDSQDDQQFELIRSERVDPTSAMRGGRTRGQDRLRGGATLGGTRGNSNITPDPYLDPSLQNSPSERVLSAKDLYRQGDSEANNQGMVVRERRLDGLVKPQFRYFDGKSWKSEWKLNSSGQMPRAIALCFDFPARSKMVPLVREGTTSGMNGSQETDGLASLQANSEETFSEITMLEPLAESATAEDQGLMLGGTSEVQLVVALGQVRPQPSSSLFPQGGRGASLQGGPPQSTNRNRPASPTRQPRGLRGPQ